MFRGTALSPSERRQTEGGFTLIELLVVITILGILAAVVVFSVRGVTDKGKQAAITTDAGVVRTAEEAYCAKNGSYGTEAKLVTAGLLTGQSNYTAVALTAGGACGSASSMTSAFMLGYAQANGGSPSSISQLKLAASGSPGNGYPTPFAYLRGPGYLNANYMFDPLVWKDKTGNPVPWLVASIPTPSPDGKTWVFTLRNGIKWSDGVALTPDDVAFTFNYQTGTGAAVAGNPNFYVPYLQYITSVVADDVANTVTFNLNTAFNTFMLNIAEEMVIIPQHIWGPVTDPLKFGTPSQSAGDPPQAQAYIGTGPYTFNLANFTVGTGQSEYDANPTFFLGIPYVRKLLFVLSTSSVADLLAGNIDAGAPGNEESVSNAAIAPLSALPNIANPGGWTRSIQFNFFAGFPFNNIKFRQAMAYAVNRQDLLTTILNGRGQLPSMGTLSPSHPFIAPGLPTYSFSLAAANTLLDSIGMTTNGCGAPSPTCFRTVDGTNPFTAQISTTSSPTAGDPNSRFSEQTVTLVRSYLAAVGINSSEVNDVPDNSKAGTGSAASAAQGSYQMMVEGWGNITSDPDALRTRLSDAYTGVLKAGCTLQTNHSGCYTNGSFTEVYGWNATNDQGGTDHSADFIAKSNDQLFTTSAAQRLADVQAMQADAAADVPEIQLYVPTALIYYQPNGFSAWYATPGGTPPGPPGFNNKEVFVTGTQFGLPPGFSG
jgi:peptide/nickel transport system substrate-binding protein